MEFQAAGNTWEGSFLLRSLRMLRGRGAGRRRQGGSFKDGGSRRHCLKTVGKKTFQVEESGHAKAWEHKGVSPGAGTWKGRRGWKS